MDDDEEYGPGRMFQPGDGVLIETIDGWEAGVLTIFASLGVFFRSTHREEVREGVSPEELRSVKAMIETLNLFELIRMARELKVSFHPLMAKDKLVYRVQQAAMAEYKERYGAPRKVLVERKKDALRFIPLKQILNVTSSADYSEDVELSELLSDLEHNDGVPLAFIKLAEAGEI